MELPVPHNLLPRVLSLPSSRKYPGCGWSRVYVYKSNPHREWVFDLIVSTLSMEVKVALPYRRYLKKLRRLFVRDPAWLVLRFYSNFYEYEVLIEREVRLF